MSPTLKEREAIACNLGIKKCDHCLKLCPYCPRLLAVRPDLAWIPPEGYMQVREQGPGFTRKAINFSKAITQHIAAGLPEADEDTVSRRLEICQDCSYFDAARAACRLCGCSMTVKVRWAEQKCPDGKW